MKRIVPSVLATFLLITTGQFLQAQSNFLPDQNPGYTVSRDKHIRHADSLTAWHSTTVQETYKAIDYLADQREARLERRAFHRQLRLIRAANRWSYNSSYYDYDYNDYNYNRRASSRYYRNPYNYRYTNNNYWSNLPLIVTLALLCR